MDRKPELLEGGACTVSLATAGCSEPADTCREGQALCQGPTDATLPPKPHRRHAGNNPHARPAPVATRGAQSRITKSCSSVMVGGTGTEMLTWPSLLVSC